MEIVNFAKQNCVLNSYLMNDDISDFEFGVVDQTKCKCSL